MKTLIAECPCCHTRYKVRPGQLRIAEGQVRCGKCLHVFRVELGTSALATPPSASQVLSSPPVPTPRPTSKPTSPTPHPSLGAEASRRDGPSPTPPGLRATDEAEEPLPLRLDLRAEPLQLRTPAPAPRRGVKATLLITCCGALLLGAQLLWFERQRLADQPLLAGLYPHLCTLVSCDLKSHHAYRLVTSHQISVRQHPSHAQQLQATLILENTAHFHQPFPLLRIHFSDAQGATLTAEERTARQYVDGTRYNPLRMPPGERLEITLDLPRPASGHLGYELTLLPSH